MAERLIGCQPSVASRLKYGIFRCGVELPVEHLSQVVMCSADPNKVCLEAGLRHTTGQDIWMRVTSFTSAAVVADIEDSRITL